jgi:heterotetrameric sarcosine oxidase delta subunit
MRIHCPHCGPRGHDEFVYEGDATRQRPDAGAPDGVVHDYVYLRDNPAGLHRELWFHAAGCHSWLVVERDTRNHEIRAVAFARSGS